MATIDLSRTGDRVSGSVGDQRVDFLLKDPASRAGVHGESLGAQFAGYWRIEPNFNNIDPVGLFLGEYDDQAVYLHSEVHLTPHHSLRHADLTGTVGKHELRARIAPVEAPAVSPAVVAVDGDFDRNTITLIATVAPDLSEAHITGVVAGRSTKIDATHSTITGQYDGPAMLLPLLIGCLLYFI